MASQVLFDQQILNAKIDQDEFGLAPSSGNSPYVSGSLVGLSLEYTFHCLFSTGSNAGQLVVETCHDPAFTGTWANVATVDYASANTVHYVSLTGCFRALRVRISTAIGGGGTASVWCIASSR